MGTFETVLLTIAVVVIDLLILKEYLHLEEELARVKQLNPPASSELVSMAQEVVAPLPGHQEGESTRVFAEPAVEVDTEAKRQLERENEQLKAANEALFESKRGLHANQLDALGSQINDILTSVKETREKVVETS